MAHVLAVCSGKGGVGKTFSALSIATEFSIRGFTPILVVDADPSRNTSTRCLPFSPNDLAYTLEHIFRDKDVAAAKAIYECTEDYPNIKVMAGSDNLDKIDQIVAGRKNVEKILHRALSQVASEYKLIIIDCPPHRGTMTANALSAATAYITPYDLGPDGVDGVFRMDKLLNDLLDEDVISAAPLFLGAFCTMYGQVNSRGTKGAVKEANEAFRESNTLRLDIKIPYSSHVKEAINGGTTLQDQRKHPVSIAYQEITNHICKKLNIKTEGGKK